VLATWHFHIEISSRCTLRCPRCARQEVPESLINTELNLDFFQKNFTSEFVQNHIEKITFCGDDGDPIYAHDLISVIQYIKSIKPVEIVIVTNGSHKKSAWWTELGRTLDPGDSVHFSIDGYDNASNNLYRVNSDYDSIITAVKTLRANSECHLTWAAIAFSFNEHHISDMMAQAQHLGMDVFQLTKSTKFGSIYPTYGSADSLEPSKEFVSGSHRFERIQTNFTDRPRPVNARNLALYEKHKNHNDIVPLCAIGNKGLYIDARGRLFPCCWVANRYGHNSEWQLLANKFNLHERDLIQVLADDFWKNKFQSFSWQECQTKCHKSVVSKEYATQW
jgi:MoaA/NifB/PqqE/SkfB family radical SAM enzyme